MLTHNLVYVLGHVFTHLFKKLFTDVLTNIFTYIPNNFFTVPLSTGEWLLSFWSAHLEAKKNLDPKSRPFEAIVEEGEIIFVPHGFWHMVLNLDDCIAITQNYVSTSNLSDCLRFLREKPDQISGKNVHFIYFVLHLLLFIIIVFF